MALALVRTLEERTAANPAAPPSEWHPSYVHACHEQAWTFRVRHKRGEAIGRNIPYKCGSRHHAGPCRDRWCRRLYGRIQAPESEFSSSAPDDVMFWTLTLPPNWHRDPTVPKRLAANKALGAQLRRFVGMTNKRLARQGAPRLKYFWIREDHKSGVPHLHLLVVSAHLAAELELRDAKLVLVPEGDEQLAPDDWRARACKAGFGVRFDAQLARDREALAGYMTKVMARLSGEVTKQGQVAEQLPSSCRSYGYTRGFLPSPVKRTDWTGWIDDEHGRQLKPQASEERAVRRSFERDAQGPDTGRIFDSRNPMASWHVGEWRAALAIASAGAGLALDPTAAPARVYRLTPRASVDRSALAPSEVLHAFESRGRDVLDRIPMPEPDQRASSIRRLLVHGMDDPYVAAAVRTSRHAHGVES